MKIILKIILAIVIGFIVYGYYINNSEFGQGEKFIGLGVLILAFVLMPLFVYHRYKNKNLSSFTLENHRKNKEEN
ncbi:MAG: hypothetical protein L3J08_04120 [Flavobacteriaceae bacterium]|nr:hypothetical protein [Flavobacteriaceae bacterium]